MENREDFGHLRGIEEIANIFGVSRATVRLWHKKGAPVLIVGKKYQTNYNDLWTWIKKIEKTNKKE